MLLKNCKIASSKGVVLGDIKIEDEKITEIGKNLKGEETINVKGKVVMPGIVDVHVHMRDFKEKYKEDFLSGSMAALAGGITSIVDMPNSSPPVIDEYTFNERVKEGEKKSMVDFGINFGITSYNADSEKPACIACKIYMNGILGEISDENLEIALEKCKKIAVHAEDAKLNKRPEAEEKAVAKICQLAMKIEKHVHICHVSYRRSLLYLNKFTTCEVTPHHLLLTQEELKEMGGIANTNPPLRSRADNVALWKALKAGKIGVIASDHAPHSVDEKEDPAFPGIPNLDIMLRLFLTLVNKRKITLMEMIKAMCENPAKIFGFEKGEIAPGKDADLLILNMKEEGIIDPYEFYSKAKYSPFEGWKTQGNVEKVFLRGKLAYDEDFMVKKGYGKWIGGMKCSNIP
jgi:dihydroorotase